MAFKPSTLLLLSRALILGVLWAAMFISGFSGQALAQADHTIEVFVFDEFGDPIAGADVVVGSADDPENDALLQADVTDVFGEVSFEVVGENETYYVFVTADNFSSDVTFADLVEQPSIYTVVSYLSLADAEITVRFLDENGNERGFLAEDHPIAYCSALNDTFIGTGFPFPGEIGFILDVPAGDYECSVETESGEAFDAPIVSVGPGESVDAPVGPLVEIGTITIQLQDSQTKALLDIEALGVADSLDDNFSFTSADFFENGSVTVPIFARKPGDTVLYEVYPYFDSVDYDFAFEGEGLFVLTESGEVYAAAFDLVQVEVGPGENRTVVYELAKLTSLLDITLRDEAGNLIENGLVDVCSYGSGTQVFSAAERRARRTAQVPRSISAAEVSEDVCFYVELEQGKTLFPVAPGRTYDVYAYPDFSSDSQFLAPPVQQITAADGATHTLTFTAPIANHQVNVNTTLPSGVSAQFLDCWGYDLDGRWSYATGEEVASLTLRIAFGEPREPWVIGCLAVGGASGEEKFYQAEAIYLQPPGVNSGSVDLSLTEQGNFYADKTVSFDAAREVKFVFPDGRTTIEIPAQALATEGEATMSVGSGRGYTFSDEEFPLNGLTFDIRFTVDGQKVEKARKPVTVRYAISKAELNQLGITSREIAVGSFNPKTFSWQQDARYTYDDERQSLTAALGHFSVWSVLVNKAKALQLQTPGAPAAGTPEKLNRKKSRINLTWSAPSASNPATVYEVELVTVKGGAGGKKKKKKKKKNKKKKKAGGTPPAEIFSTTGTSLSLDLPKGSYTFRVAIEGGVYSEAQAFTIR